MKLSISHPKLTMIRFEINGQIVPHSQINQEFVVDVNQESNIEVFFEPWKTKPLVRINSHLIDYWLADIMQFDHMIQVRWDNNFYQRYQEKNIQCKMRSLGITKQEDIDYYLGINNSNFDIVEQIKKYL